MSALPAHPRRERRINHLSMPCLVTAPPTAPGEASGCYHVERDSIYSCRSPDARLLARCPSGRTAGRVERAERDANLALFAASPLMRKTLQEAYRQLQGSREHGALRARIGYALRVSTTAE